MSQPHQSQEGLTHEWAEEEQKASGSGGISEGKRPDGKQRIDGAQLPDSSAPGSDADRSQRSASKRARKRNALGLPLTKSDLARAVVLTEILGAPRSQNPWRGNRNR